MLRKKLRKTLRRLVIWALTDQEPTVLVNWDINTGKNRFDDTELFVRGLSSKAARRTIVNHIKTAQFDREL